MFSPITSVFPAKHSTDCSTLIIVQYHPGLVQETNNGLSNRRLVSTPTPKKSYMDTFWRSCISISTCKAAFCPRFILADLSRLTQSQSVPRGVPYILEAVSEGVLDFAVDTASFQRFCSLMIKVILDRVHGHVFYIKHSVSETGFCLRLHVEPTHASPIEKASLCLWTGVGSTE
jgi:hypothetical protein